LLNTKCCADFSQECHLNGQLRSAFAGMDLHAVNAFMLLFGWQKDIWPVRNNA